MKFRVVAVLLAALGAPSFVAAYADAVPGPEAPAATAPAPPVIVPARAVAATHNCGGYYPSFARRLGYTGYVYVTYDVAADGDIANVALARSSGRDALDLNALRCVREHWRDTPATVDGKPFVSPGHRAAIHFGLGQQESAQDFYEDGMAAVFIGDDAKAVEHFAEALQLDPGYADAYRQRGLAYDRLGDREHAAADFARTGKSTPPTLPTTPGPTPAH